MRTLLLLTVALIVACTNDYSSFRYPRKHGSGGSTGAAGSTSDAAADAPSTDAGTP